MSKDSKNPHYDKDIISKCKMGTVVKVYDIPTPDKKREEMPYKIGHVVGFGLNSSKEISVRISFAGDEHLDYYIHPVHIEFL